MISCSYTDLKDPLHLVPHPKNPNKHDKEQIDLLARLISFYGFRHPIIVSNRTGFIVAGHGRLEAAKKLGLKEVPVDYQDFTDDAQEYGFLVADNAIAGWSELDLAKINVDFVDLGPDFDVDMLGIKDFQIEPIDKLEPGCDEDEVPEHVEPKTKLGDVYKLGNHRLICGDSTSIDAVEKLMNGEKADMVFTDPPYGIGYDDTKHKNYHGYKASNFGIIKGDDKEFNWLDFQWLEQGEQIWFGANYYCKQLPQSGSWYVWDKKTEAMQQNGMLFTNDFEIAWSKKKHKQEICRKIWAGAINKEKGESRLHPTQKPIGLIEWFFERIKGEKVIDLFGGSGSTLIACEKTNRKCFMMELDPHYCDVIVARWEKYTGQKAELING